MSGGKLSLLGGEAARWGWRGLSAHCLCGVAHSPHWGRRRWGQAVRDGDTCLCSKGWGHVAVPGCLVLPSGCGEGKAVYLLQVTPPAALGQFVPQGG